MKYRKTVLEVNEIVKDLTDDEILVNNGVFKTLAYWTKNVDICITLDMLPTFLKMYGYDVKK